MAGIRVEMVVDHQGKEQRLNLLRQPDDSLTDIVNDTLTRLNLPRNPPYWVAFSGGKPQRLNQSLSQALPTTKKHEGAVVLELRAPAPEAKKETPNNKPAATAKGKEQVAVKVKEAPPQAKPKEQIKTPAKPERSKDPDLAMTQPMPKAEAPATPASVGQPVAKNESAPKNEPPVSASPNKPAAVDKPPEQPAAKNDSFGPSKTSQKKPKEPPPPEPVLIKVEAVVSYKEEEKTLSMERKGNDSLLEILHDILSELSLPRNPPSWAVWSEDQPHRLIETLERAVPKSVAGGFVKLEVMAGETEVESWSPLAADTALDLASGALYQPNDPTDLLFSGDDEEESAPGAAADKTLAEKPHSPAPAPPPPPPGAMPARGRAVAPAPVEAEVAEEDVFVFKNEAPAVVPEAAPAAEAVDEDSFHPAARDELRRTGAETGIPEVGADLDEMPSSESLPMPSLRAGRGGGGGGAAVSRNAAVRYYSRMNPARAYPFAVVISDNVLSEIAQEGVAQAASAGFKTSMGASLEIEPILPGCYVYPAKREVRVRPGDVVAKFCVVPHLEGDLLEPHVIIRQDGLTIAEIPLEMRVVKQTLTWALGVAAFVVPMASAFLRYFRIDTEAKVVNDGIGLFTNLIRLFFGVLPPELLWLLLLAVTAGLYFTLRPQQKDLFWELKTVTPDSVLAKARKIIEEGDPVEGIAMIEGLLQTHPQHQAAWLACARAHFEQDDLEEALRCYDHALTLGHTNTDHFSRAIKSATKLNRHERAHTLLVQARKCLAASDFKALQALLQG